MDDEYTSLADFVLSQGEAQARDVAIPTEPMTYDQLVKSGYGSRRPDILWVPVRPDSPAQPEQTPFQSCDSHLDSNSSVERPDRIKRQLSDDLDEIRSQEIQSRNKSYSPCSDSVKRGRVTPRSEVNVRPRAENFMTAGYRDQYIHCLIKCFNICFCSIALLHGL